MPNFFTKAATGFGKMAETLGLKQKPPLAPPINKLNFAPVDKSNAVAFVQGRDNYPGPWTSDPDKYDKFQGVKNEVHNHMEYIDSKHVSHHKFRKYSGLAAGVSSVTLIPLMIGSALTAPAFMAGAAAVAAAFIITDMAKAAIHGKKMHKYKAVQSEAHGVAQDIHYGTYGKFHNFNDFPSMLEELEQKTLPAMKKDVKSNHSWDYIIPSTDIFKAHKRDDDRLRQFEVNLQDQIGSMKNYKKPAPPHKL